MLSIVSELDHVLKKHLSILSLSYNYTILKARKKKKNTVITVN